MYDGPEHAFGRQDQREESDLGFVQRLAKERGMNCKVHDGRLVLFDGAGADARPAALTIAKRGGMYSPASYSFKESSSKTDYGKAEVAYTDPAAGTTHTAKVTVPEGPPDAKTLQLNTRVESAARGPCAWASPGCGTPTRARKRRTWNSWATRPWWLALCWA